jgi:lactoylglutathione lyase
LKFIKINERQYLELFKETGAGSDRLSHVAVEVDDAEAMRRYLAAHGVKVPDTVPKGKLRNSNFSITDADGHSLEFVQYEPDGWTVREKGKAMPESRIATKMTHAGILVGSLDPALRFYRDLLGFQETWRGSRDEKVLNWVNLKVPDGDDYIEFMLYDQMPAADQRGTAHHLCLVVPDIEKSRETLGARPGYDRPMEIRTGINRKRQLNLYDPDGTRVELMEPKTVDGRNVPPSKAPPPR